MTGGLEVGTRTAADWELAIIQGWRIFRLLVQHDGGAVDFNADERTLTFRPPAVPH
jgi:hypothetical protein